MPGNATVHTRRKAMGYRSDLAHEEIIVDGFNEKKAIIAAIASLVLIFGVTGTAVIPNGKELQL